MFAEILKDAWSLGRWGEKVRKEEIVKGIPQGKTDHGRR